MARTRFRVLREKQPDNPGYIAGLVAFGTLAFLEGHLQNQPKALHYLMSDAILAYPGGRVEFRRK
jgi:hypothetical protein